MNAGLEANDPSVYYYDGDYPSKFHSVYPENFDSTTVHQGLFHDVDRYREIAKEVNGAVLELCCGTGRVAIPIANDGHQVTGVDISQGILEQFKKNLQREKTAAERITLVEQDITELNLKNREYKLAIIAFNSLLCIPDFNLQMQALKSINQHLLKDALLVIDIVNPLKISQNGDSTPRAFYTRRNPHNGNKFTRFSMRGAFDENHRQELYGWYDEILEDETVKRKMYSLYWRPIYRFEIELMLKEAGFKVEKIEGGHQKEIYKAESDHLFIHARRE